MHGFAQFLAATPSLIGLDRAVVLGPAPSVDRDALGAMSMGITLVGIGLASLIFLGRRTKAARLARVMNAFGLYSLSYGKFFFDPIYAVLVVGPLLGIARLAALFDHYVIDGLVDLCGKLPKLLGAALRPVQNGLVQFYALAMMVGLLVLVFTLLM
jgi:NADH-quinone oxidoreductase subunit L